MAITRAMLMAAGLGTRLRPFTEKYPKALMPLMGVPMIQFAIDALVAAGVREIVVNIHHHGEIFLRGLERLDWGGARLIVSDERDQLLGSAGGIRKALGHYKGEPFFLVNADVLSDINLTLLGRHHELMKCKYGVGVTLGILPGGSGFYREIEFDPESLLIHRVGEVVSGKPYFMGAAVLEPSAIAGLPEGPGEFVPMILQPAVAAGRACACSVSCSWKDVGSPALWLEAHCSLLEDLETGRVSKIIRKRIEKVSVRLADRIWGARNVSWNMDRSGWAGPVYLGEALETKAGNKTKTTFLAGSELGPRAVVYGDMADVRGSGIGALNEWVPLSGVARTLSPSFRPG